jgi:hypothetical protein
MAHHQAWRELRHNRLRNERGAPAPVCQRAWRPSPGTVMQSCAVDGRRIAGRAVTQKAISCGNAIHNDEDVVEITFSPRLAFGECRLPRCSGTIGPGIGGVIDEELAFDQPNRFCDPGCFRGERGRLPSRRGPGPAPPFVAGPPAEPGVGPVGPGRRRSGVAAVTPGNCLLAAFPPAAARLGDVRGRAGAAARGVGRVRDGSPGRPPHNQLEAFRAQPPAFFIFPECYDYVQSRLASAKPFVIGKKSLFFSWICCALNVSVRYKP